MVSLSVTPATVPDVINELPVGAAVSVGDTAAGAGLVVVVCCCDGAVRDVTGAEVAEPPRVKFHAQISSLGSDEGTRQPLPGQPTVRVRVPLIVALVGGP